MKDSTLKDKNQLPIYPGLLPYGHSLGAPAFRPTEMGTVISKSLSAMNEQVEIQKKQILEQLALLEKQYADLEERRLISNLVYGAEIRFKPDAGNTYYLYVNETLTTFLSLIGPTEWSPKKITYLATVKLLHDLTWEVVHKSSELILKTK